MKSKTSPITLIPNDTAKVINHGEEIKPGDWFWFNRDEDRYDFVHTLDAPDGFNTLVCVDHVGSNFVNIRTPDHSSWRIHFDEINDELLPATSWKDIVARNLHYQQAGIDTIVSSMHKICSGLGVNNDTSEGETSNALIALSSNHNLDLYNNSLVDAKDNLIPQLKKDLDKKSELMAYWLKADTVSLEITKNDLKKYADTIDDRIHNVALYAGIDEDVAHIREGWVAGRPEIIHVMQRLHYMDEESLVDYDAGGMSFEGISEFDAWIARDNNFKRLLPFNKTICAFRVRRNKKDRGPVFSLLDSFIRISLEEADMYTFLYIRNGDNLYRLCTTIEFNEVLFPDKKIYNPTDELMIKQSGSYDIIYMSVNDYDERIKQERLDRNRHKANSHSGGGDNNSSDRYSPSFSPSGWEPFNSGCVFYDDAIKDLHDSLMVYNKTALVIQGVFDRSTALAPHPKINLTKGNDFVKYIKLVYDSSNALSYGEAPDFRAYLDACNETLCEDSVCVGQEMHWMAWEHEKDRRRNGWRSRSGIYYASLPYGNDGPGLYAKANKVLPRAKKVRFRWMRDRRKYDYYETSQVPAVFTLSIDKVLNLSAYKKGDYKQFFVDPRTRADYLKWAPLLLAAEDYLRR